VDVERVGVCGTDVELFTGEMQYLRDGHASFPLRPATSGAARSRR
jgi:threonine dehydrogenase-like Zn-dependent dehydrogenase